MTDLSEFDDQNILARTAFGEARGGGVEGMQSVLNVIMNRAASPGWWGKSPRLVCLKPYQFSCWLTDDPNYPLITSVDQSNATFADAMQLASQALNGGLDDITNGATYYFAETMTQWPHWAVGHKPCAEIARQLFFNDVE